MKVLGEWKNVCVQGEGTGLLRLEERTGDCWIALYAQLSAGDAVQEKASAAVDALKEDPVTAAGAVLTVAASSAVKAIGVALGADSHVMRRTPGFENDFAKEFSKTFAETSELVMRKRLIFEKNLSDLTNCSRSGNTVSLEIGQNYRLTFEDQEYGESMSRGFLGTLEDARSQINDARIKQDIDWTLDANGLLTLKGCGKMPDWQYYLDDRKADTPWYERRDDIKVVHISAGFVNLGNCAFYECGNLTSIVLPNCVTSIGKYAFHGCKNLTNIHIPDSVTSIGGSAFSHCKKLTNIHIPNGVTEIRTCTFSWCVNLINIEIPSSVTSIHDFAFLGCEKLTSVHIPSSVTSIGKEAFKGCKKMTSIHISDGVTSIGTDAFSECKSLTEIRIPNSVTTLDMGVFSKCKNLKRVYMPKRFDSPLFSLRFGISKEKVTFT